MLKSYWLDVLYVDNAPDGTRVYDLLDRLIVRRVTEDMPDSKDDIMALDDLDDGYTLGWRDSHGPVRVSLQRKHDVQRNPRHHLLFAENIISQRRESFDSLEVLTVLFYE